MASQSPWSAIGTARHLLKITAKDFTDDDLKQAYRIAAKMAHPDAGGSDQAMAEVNAARDVLQPLTVESKQKSGRSEGETLAYIEDLLTQMEARHKEWAKDREEWAKRRRQEREAEAKPKPARKPKVKAKAKPAAAKVTLQVSSTGVLTNPEGVVLGRFSDSAAAAGYCVNTGWDYALEGADG